MNKREASSQLNTKNKQQCSDIPRKFPVVMENDTCQFWESDGDGGIITMQECWYCKYSDFRKLDSERIAQSICRCPKVTAISKK